jgi:hypothetical protein
MSKIAPRDRLRALLRVNGYNEKDRPRTHRSHKRDYISFEQPQEETKDKLEEIFFVCETFVKTDIPKNKQRDDEEALNQHRLTIYDPSLTKLRLRLPTTTEYRLRRGKIEQRDVKRKKNRKEEQEKTEKKSSEKEVEEEENEEAIEEELEEIDEKQAPENHLPERYKDFQDEENEVAETTKNQSEAEYEKTLVKGQKARLNILDACKISILEVDRMCTKEVRVAMWNYMMDELTANNIDMKDRTIRRDTDERLIIGDRHIFEFLWRGLMKHLVKLCNAEEKAGTSDLEMLVLFRFDGETLTTFMNRYKKAREKAEQEGVDCDELGMRRILKQTTPQEKQTMAQWNELNPQLDMNLETISICFESVPPSHLAKYILSDNDEGVADLMMRVKKMETGLKSMRMGLENSRSDGKREGWKFGRGSKGLWNNAPRTQDLGNKNKGGGGKGGGGGGQGGGGKGGGGQRFGGPGKPPYFSPEDRAKHKAGLICRGCNKMGHMQKDCPEEKCRLCEKKGHAKRNCPEIDCKKCGEKGHIQYKCPRNGQTIGEKQSHDQTKHEGNTGERRFPSRCDHCKKRGHTEDRCFVLHPKLAPKKTEREYRAIEIEFKDLNPKVRTKMMMSAEASESYVIEQSDIMRMKSGILKAVTTIKARENSGEMSLRKSAIDTSSAVTLMSRENLERMGAKKATHLPMIRMKTGNGYTPYFYQYYVHVKSLDGMKRVAVLGVDTHRMPHNCDLLLGLKHIFMLRVDMMSVMFSSLNKEMSELSFLSDEKWGELCERFGLSEELSAMLIEEDADQTLPMNSTLLEKDEEEEFQSDGGASFY